MSAVSDLIERIAAMIPGPVSHQVSDWPSDEIEYFRSGDWTDFTDREAGLTRLRNRKAAAAIVASLGLDRLVDGTTTQPPALAAPLSARGPNTEETP